MASIKVKPLRILSLGAGVQSTTLALMAAHGEIDPVDCAVFADTQSEPQSVYTHLRRLRAALPFPVHVVSKGSLRQELIDARGLLTGLRGEAYLHSSRQPLDTINFVAIEAARKARNERQPDLFGNECEGMCGV